MRTLVRLAGFLLLSCWWLPAQTAAVLRGIVLDSTGATVRNATVEIRAAGGTLRAVRQTDAEGRFEWTEGRSSPLQIRVSSEGFAVREMLLSAREQAAPVEVVLEPASVYTRLTVTATRGGADEAVASPHVAMILERSDMLKRPAATLGDALHEQPGVLLQKSTCAQTSPFLRGLTGYHVLNLIDGIRFNNSTFRSGPNQYLAFVEPMQVQRVESLLGPTGSQYGSDSLGGTIQVLTGDSRFAEAKQWDWHGDLALGGATADWSGFGSGRLSAANDKYYWLGGVSGRQHNDLRAGRGYDSRNVFRRLFGLPRDQVRGLLGSRQQDTGFRQYSVQTKFAALTRPDQLWTLYYLRGVQDNVRGYRDLLGGLGRVLSRFEPQTLNWFHGRYEKASLGWLDSLAATFSLNSQSDGSERQNLRYTDPITRDHSRVDSYGYTAQAAAHRGAGTLLVFGGEFYDERIRSEREERNPLTGTVARPRPLYPDGSAYQNLGLFGQAGYDLTQAVRASGSLRYTNVRYHTREDRRFGIPDSTRWFRDLTFHGSLRWQISRAFGWHAIVSRGFRAPNLNDLGALGHSSLGYEVPAAEAMAAGALLSSDAGESALSKGVGLQPLRAESLLNHETGVRVATRRLYARIQGFDAEFHDPIVRRTLLFPASSMPSQLGGMPVTVIPPTPAQRAQGVVAVADQVDSRAVKAFVNDGRSRYYGVEGLLRFSISSRWTLQGHYSFIVGRDLDPNRPARRLPPQMGSSTLRYTPTGRRPWFEISLTAAGAQRLLSGGDIDDERIGASLRRRDIQDFFTGSRVAPYLNGAVFTPTGETLAQLQNRVLPIGVFVNGVRVVNDTTRVPLYLSTAGWCTLNARSGFSLGERWQVIAALENLLDRNYRFHGSGFDAPGISAYLSLAYRF